jgi:hypothetical protein
MFFHKSIYFNFFYLALAFTVIGFFNEFQFQSLGKFITYLSVVLFLFIFFNEKDFQNYKYYILLFSLVFFILYFSNHRVADFFTFDFLKKFTQILISLLIFFFFYY